MSYKGLSLSCPDWFGTSDPPTSASQAGEITDVHMASLSRDLPTAGTIFGAQTRAQSSSISSRFSSLKAPGTPLFFSLCFKLQSITHLFWASSHP